MEPGNEPWDFSLEAIEDRANVCFEYYKGVGEDVRVRLSRGEAFPWVSHPEGGIFRLKYRTGRLVRALQTVGIRRLTRDNWIEAGIRIKLAEIIDIPASLLQSHIGLTVEGEDWDGETFDRWLIAEKRKTARERFYYYYAVEESAASNAEAEHGA